LGGALGREGETEAGTLVGGKEPPTALPPGPEPPKSLTEGTKPAQVVSGTSEPATQKPASETGATPEASPETQPTSLPEQPAETAPKVDETTEPQASESSKGSPRKRSYYGGGEGGRKGMRTVSPDPIVEKAPRLKTPAAELATGLSDTERTMVSEAEQASSRLGKPLKVKTKGAAREGKVKRSGFGKRGGGKELTQKVMDTGQEIGHDFAKNSSLDEGIPGQEKASHAEKLAAIENPGKPLAVDRVICPDCVAFFQKLAQARGTTLVVQEPGITWVFRPDGVRVGLSPYSIVVRHPSGRASAGQVP